jgi:hypothetical protein
LGVTLPTPQASAAAESVEIGFADEPGHESISASFDELATITESISRVGLAVPTFTEEQTGELRSLYAYVDPQGQVPQALLTKALSYYHSNLDKINNKNYLTIVDFSQHSSKTRFYVINMSTGAVWTIHVAHGKNSDPSNSGFATRFSNVVGSEETSLGFYMTAETYDGEHGLSLRIDGLSSTNTNARSRDIVVHGASYVSDGDVQAGRSWGCLAVPMDDRDKVVSDLKGGSIIFAADSASLD